MLSAKITNETRKAVYRRDGFRCALCDDTRGLQIHHVVRRSQGGTDFPHNLITLCWRCHAAAHGTVLPATRTSSPQTCARLAWNTWRTSTPKKGFSGIPGRRSRNA